MDHIDTIDTLNTLIETSKDGEFGFRSSAEHLKSADLRALFNQRANDCQRAASDLQAHVVRLGGEAEDGGTAMGGMQRGWVAVKGTLAGYSDESILEDAERGEDMALETYRNALSEGLPAEVRTLVEQQFVGVERNHAHIRTLRDQARVMAR